MPTIMPLFGLLLFAGATFLLLLTFVVALIEKQPVMPFELLPPEQNPEPCAYAKEINESLSRNGFQQDGVYRHVNGGSYKTHTWMWYSEGRETLAVVGAGTIFGTRLRKTSLLTRIGDNNTLATLDEPSPDRLADNYISEFLLNADGEELLELHRERVAGSSGRVTPFPAPSADGFQRVMLDRAERLEQRGYIYFLDSGRTAFRHTLRGALAVVFRGVLGQIRVGKKQRDRLDKKRPGD